MVSIYCSIKVYIFIITYLLNIDTDNDIVIFRQYRIDIVAKSKSDILKHH